MALTLSAMLLWRLYERLLHVEAAPIRQLQIKQYAARHGEIVMRKKLRRGS